MHLATGGEETRAITNAWRNRYNDFRIFSDPDTTRLLEEQNVKLIGWRDLHGLMPE
jgi:hypothetical protein